MKIALLGYGVVGSGVYELINQNQKRYMEEYDQPIEIVGILVNSLQKYADLPHHALFTNDFETLFNLSFDIAIETIGGVEPAYTYVDRLLAAGKPVVTSNKDLIAEKGALLHETARQHQVTLSYEASVGGGIPVLKPLRECLAGDQIKEIMGIINGTTNFILTKMIAEGLSYEVALKEAQRLGFAEANPTSDVEGLDAVRKISILTKLGPKVALDWKQIPVQGITKITACDVACFNKLDKTVKLIGMSLLLEDGIYASVRPTVIPKHSKFGTINNEFNAISVVGEAVGELFFSGKGAGKNPTATAVVGDVMDILQNNKRKVKLKLETLPQIRHYPHDADWIIPLEAAFDHTQTALMSEKLGGVDFELVHPEDSCDAYLILKSINEITCHELLDSLSIAREKIYLSL